MMISFLTKIVKRPGDVDHYPHIQVTKGNPDTKGNPETEISS